MIVFVFRMYYTVLFYDLEITNNPSNIELNSPDNNRYRLLLYILLPSSLIYYLLYFDCCIFSPLSCLFLFIYEWCMFSQFVHFLICLQRPRILRKIFFIFFCFADIVLTITVLILYKTQYYEKLGIVSLNPFQGG